MFHARLSTVWCAFVMFLGEAYDPCNFLHDQITGFSTYNTVCQDEADDGLQGKFCDQYLVLGHHNPPLIKVIHHGNPKWTTRSTFNQNPRNGEPQKLYKSDQNLPRAWYIFMKPGSQVQSLNMPTENPVTGCGTRHPAWMDGTIPLPAEYIVSRYVCVNNLRPCSSKYNISVRNCGDGITAYLLTPLTHDRLSAYCFGQYRPCQGNSSSSTGFDPGCRSTCGEPQVINGRVRAGGRGYGSRFLEGNLVTVDCYRGFFAPNTRMACSNSEWTPSSVNCKVICTDLEVNNGEVQYNAYPGYPVSVAVEGHVVTVRCNPGGTRTATCQSDGTWSPRPRCAGGCDAPTIANSRPSRGYPFSPGDVAEVLCVEGSFLSGSPLITCQEDGSWSPQLPACIGRCRRPAIRNAVLSSTTYFFEVGEGVEVRCKLGYVLVGSSTITCGPRGTWTSALPSCKNTCKEVEINKGKLVDENGAPVDNAVAGQVAYVSCHGGHEAVPVDRTTCLENGQWTVVPSCHEIRCWQPPITNSVLAGSTPKTYVFGRTVQVNCLPGYVLIGPKHIICTVTGNWTKLPTCQVQGPKENGHNSSNTNSSSSGTSAVHNNTPSDVVWIIPLVVLLFLLLCVAVIGYFKYDTVRGIPFSGRRPIKENHDVLRHKLAEAVRVGTCMEPALDEYKKFCMQHFLFVRMDLDLCKTANKAIEELKEKERNSNALLMSLDRITFRSSHSRREHGVHVTTSASKSALLQTLSIPDAPAVSTDNERRSSTYLNSKAFELKVNLAEALQSWSYTAIKKALSTYYGFCSWNSEYVCADEELVNRAKNVLHMNQMETNLRMAIQTGDPDAISSALTGYETLGGHDSFRQHDNVLVTTARIALCEHEDGKRRAMLEEAMNKWDKGEIVQALRNYEHFAENQDNEFECERKIFYEASDLVKQTDGILTKQNALNRLLRKAISSSNVEELTHILEDYNQFLGEHGRECSVPTTLLEEAQQILMLPSLKQSLIHAVEEGDLMLMNDAIEKVIESGIEEKLQPEMKLALGVQENIREVQKLREAVLNLDRETSMEIRSYDHPSQIVHDVMRAALIVVGDGDQMTRDWERCRSRCSSISTPGNPGLFNRVRKFDVKQLNPEVAEHVLDILSGFTSSDVEHVSFGMSVFYLWVKSVCRLCLSTAHLYKHRKSKNQPESDMILNDASITKLREKQRARGMSISGWVTPEVSSGTPSTPSYSPSKTSDTQPDLSLQLRLAVEQKDFPAVEKSLNEYLSFSDDRKFDHQLSDEAKQVLVEYELMKTKESSLKTDVNQAIAKSDRALVLSSLEHYKSFCHLNAKYFDLDKSLVEKVQRCLSEIDETTKVLESNLVLKSQLSKAIQDCDITAVETFIDEYEAHCVSHKEFISLDKRIFEKAKLLLNNYKTTKAMENSLKTTLSTAISKSDLSSIDKALKDYKSFCQANVGIVVLDKSIIQDANNVIEADGRRNSILEAQSQLETQLTFAISTKNGKSIERLLQEYMSLCDFNKDYVSVNLQLIEKAKRASMEFVVMREEEEALKGKLSAALKMAVYPLIQDALEQYEAFYKANIDIIALDEFIVQKSKGMLKERGQQYDALKDQLLRSMEGKDPKLVREALLNYEDFCKAHFASDEVDWLIVAAAKHVINTDVQEPESSKTGDEQLRREVQERTADGIKQELINIMKSGDKRCARKAFRKYTAFCRQEKIDMDKSLAAAVKSYIKEPRADKTTNQRTSKSDMTVDGKLDSDTKGKIPGSVDFSEAKQAAHELTDILKDDSGTAVVGQVQSDERKSSIENKLPVIADKMLRDLMVAMTNRDQDSLFMSLARYRKFCNRYQGKIETNVSVVVKADALLKTLTTKDSGEQKERSATQQQQRDETTKEQEVREAADRLRQDLVAAVEIRDLTGLQTNLKTYQMFIEEHSGKVDIDQALVKKASSMLRRIAAVRVRDGAGEAKASLAQKNNIENQDTQKPDLDTKQRYEGEGVKDQKPRELADQLRQQLNVAVGIRDWASLETKLSRYRRFHMMHAGKVAIDEALVKKASSMLRRMVTDREHKSETKAGVVKNFEPKSLEPSSTVPDGLTLKNRIDNAIEGKNLEDITSVIESIRQPETIATLQSDLANLENIRTVLLSMNQKRLDILNMSSKSFGDMRNHEDPSSCISNVIRAVLVLMGYSESETSDWSSCQEIFSNKRTRENPGFMKKFRSFDWKSVDVVVASRAAAVLAGVVRDDLLMANKDACLFYDWVNMVCTFYRISGLHTSRASTDT